jgi:repressor of nif and glnA expression
MKKFRNAAKKIDVILSVFNDGEKLESREIVQRIREKGYEINDSHLRMFIRYHMLYEHLRKECTKGPSRYCLI